MDYGERRGGYRILVGRSEGRRQLGGHNFMLEDCMKMNLTGTAWGA